MYSGGWWLLRSTQTPTEHLVERNIGVGLIAVEEGTQNDEKSEDDYSIAGGI